MNNWDDSHEESIDVTLQNIRTSVEAIILQGAEPDTDLLDILKKRIVVSSPDEYAVKQAMDDIEKLIDERAKGH